MFCIDILIYSCVILHEEKNYIIKKIIGNNRSQAVQWNIYISQFNGTATLDAQSQFRDKLGFSTSTNNINFKLRKLNINGNF